MFSSLSIWVWCLNFLNSEPSCSFYRAGYKDCWGLRSCISISESTSSTSSNSIISYLYPRVDEGNRDFSEREGKDK